MSHRRSSFAVRAIVSAFLALTIVFMPMTVLAFVQAPPAPMSNDMIHGHGEHHHADMELAQVDHPPTSRHSHPPTDDHRSCPTHTFCINLAFAVVQVPGAAPQDFVHASSRLTPEVTASTHSICPPSRPPRV